MRKFIFLFLIAIYSCQRCLAYDLDDVEYDKMPPLFTLDNYHRCMIHNGTYCMAKVDLYAEPSNELMNQIINYTKSSHIKHYNHTYLEKGVCVTQTCAQFMGNRSLDSSVDVQSILEECINDHISKEYGLQARVPKVFYCNKPTDKKEKEVWDWIVLVVFVSIAVVNIFATIYDMTHSEDKSKNLSRGQRILLCFSMIKNWNYLLSPLRLQPKLAKLEGVNSLRVAVSFPMVLGHVCWLYLMGFIDNPHDYERAYEIPHFQLIFNGMVLVQTFFVISGFLLVYNLEVASDSHKITLKTIPAIYIRRFLRLAPPLAVMLAFTATWMRFLGSGPLWDRYATPVVNDCRRYWWTHLLFINNYVQDNKYCAIQTWYIATDTQLFFVGAVIYIMTRRKYRDLVIWLMLTISCIIPALHVYFQDLDAAMIKTPEILRFLDEKNFGASYVLGHNNMSCFIFGMFLAFKLHEWHEKGVVFKGPVYTFLYRTGVIWMILYIFSRICIYEEDFRFPLWLKMVYQGIHRLLTVLPVSILIIGVDMDLDTKYVNNIMKWKGFTILGRLTFCVYLLHMNFVPIIAGTRTQLEHLSYLNMMVDQLGIIALTYLISIPFYLMVEAPINPLVKILLMHEKALKANGHEVFDSSKSFLEVVAKKNNKAIDNEKDKINLLKNSLEEDSRNGEIMKNGVEKKSV